MSKRPGGGEFLNKIFTPKVELKCIEWANVYIYIYTPKLELKCIEWANVYIYIYIYIYT